MTSRSRNNKFYEIILGWLSPLSTLLSVSSISDFYDLKWSEFLNLNTTIWQKNLADLMAVAVDITDQIDQC